MADVPQECQALAGEVAALEAIDEKLRAQLTTLVGADAWAALAQLGQTRQQLGKKRGELDACIRDHSAVLQANLVVMDLAPANDAQPTRVGNLWEIAASGPTQRETSPVTANTFSFEGPLPAELGISVVTTGTADVVGPDFRSAPIDAGSVTGKGPLRIEVVLAPEMSIDAAVLSDLVASAFSPVTEHVSVGGGLITADVSVLTADAVLDANGVVMSANGQIEIQGQPGVTDRLAFSGKATLSLLPSAAPASVDIFDLITITDLIIDVPGAAGSILAALLPAVRGFLSGLLTDQLRQAARKELPAIVLQALVLPELPSEVNVSIRRLRIGPTAINVQPALGSIGTTLSTFRAPTIPPP